MSYTTLHNQIAILESQISQHADIDTAIEQFFTEAERLMCDAQEQEYITIEEYCQLEMDFGF